MTVTINQLLEQKVIKRGDKGLSIKLQDLHIRPGFNPRIDTRRLREEIQAKARFTAENGIENMPQLKVVPREEGGVWVVEGHGRTESTQLAIDTLGAKDKLQSKDGHVWMPIKPFIGDAVDLHLETLNSHTFPLEPIEVMTKLKELADGVDGCAPLTPADIAKRTRFTRQYIDQLLGLANKGSDEIHEMVRRGEVTADIASSMVRQLGDEAPAVLKEELAKAKAQGKKKITKGTILGKSLPRAVVDDLTSRVKSVVDNIPQSTLDILDQYRAEKITDGDTPVTLSVRELLALVMVSKHIDDTRDEQERKEKEKAEKSKKADTKKIHTAQEAEAEASE